ncbi:TIGR02281 family clan AA aspartic protease [Legionella sp. km772]|uniref:retropepsin-like aspartic protease family protein n=1 Tax=Legionella sp. km772 TaxID=2498111 RepID=UPI000F8DB4B4|nr:retropepsin-like aspartic protease [Legionella sp. km772]RUR08426.1 TIGR02281 family clan AA aspartic protease [Legionella sp. km772]
MSEEKFARTGRIMFLLVWIIIFIGFFLFFYYQSDSKSKVILANQKEFVLTANSSGHYLISGRINNYPVEFLVDTGASFVAIPQNIADTLHISGRYPMTLSTANGMITGSLTRIEQLSFGAFTLYDVKAVIIPNDDDTVLLGMNVLEHFNITQKKKQLILEQQGD